MPSEPGAPAPHERRVLLLPSTSRDAEAIVRVMSANGIECAICLGIQSFCEQIAEGAGAALVAEEWTVSGLDELAACLAAQPVWSDLPLIVLSRSGAETPSLAAVLTRLGNVSVLERPVRVTTLLSVVRSCLRARMRQYEVRRRLEEREKLLASEQAARTAAEGASRTKDEFLATLSHELRTPLNAIMGWAQILAMEDARPEDFAEGINIIERNARAQAQIIEDLLDMSRIVSGRIRLNTQKVHLADVIEAAVGTVRPAADAKGVRLTVEIDADASPVLGDPDRLHQVLWNLLSNAVKFTPQDGAVELSLEEDDGHVEVRVRDSGQGISPELLPEIFGRFWQADSSSSRKHGGLGLGLAIVKQLVELHGGTVSATSDGEGTGATFLIRIPHQHVWTGDFKEGEHAGTPPFQNSAKRMAGVIRGLKVLVVDDEPDARALLKRLLEAEGAIVYASDSAQDALHRIHAARPDVLVSDIGMPGQDGYELIRNVRSLSPDAGGATPAIALTAYARAEDRERAIGAGFQEHLAKPLEPARLISAIAELCRETANQAR